MEYPKDHYMNPFDFVPLPDKPLAIPDSILSEPHYEGVLSYTMEVLQPLHIGGAIEKKGHAVSKRHFFRSAQGPVIPGASIRGMLLSAIEAITGSDVYKRYTRGDEGFTVTNPTEAKYAKRYDASNPNNCRHVGWLAMAEDDPFQKDMSEEAKRAFERRRTLPNGFGLGKVMDVATYLFGRVTEAKVKSKDSESGSQTEDTCSQRGRLCFEDIIVPPDLLSWDFKALDLNSDSSFGAPNPRANSAWYFTHSHFRRRHAFNRNNPARPHIVWEALADKLRGRKFYFHHDAARCIEYYKNEWAPPMEGRLPLVQHAIEAVTPSVGRNKPLTGQILFRDMPFSLVQLLHNTVSLPEQFAYKLGGLKPMGFGSIMLYSTGLCWRRQDAPLSSIKPLTDAEWTNFKENVAWQRLYYDPAFEIFKKIHRHPEDWSNKNWQFYYPPYRQVPRNGQPYRDFLKQKFEENPCLKGFAQPPQVNAAGRNKVGTREIVTDLGPEHFDKLTMFFDHYQKTAANYTAVMVE